MKTSKWVFLCQKKPVTIVCSLDHHFSSGSSEYIKKLTGNLESGTSQSGLSFPRKTIFGRQMENFFNLLLKNFGHFLEFNFFN
jgi:hypothetical protein